MTSTFRPFSIFVGAAAALLCAAASPAWAQGTGNGLVGDYYTTNNWTGSILETRFNDPTQVDFQIDYGALNPGGLYPVPPLGVDNFSVRWRGQIEAPSTETYTFTINADATMRLVINGTQIASGATGSGTFPMTVNQKYDIMIEYAENTTTATTANVRLRWQSPTVTPLGNVPKNRLYSPTTALSLPTITPNVGSVCPQLVTLSTVDAGAQIYYTTNGTDPGLTAPATNSLATLYTVPFTVTTYCRVRARAYLGGMSSALLTSADFSPTFPIVVPPGPTQAGLYRKQFTITGGTGSVPNFAALIPTARAIVTTVTPAVTTTFGHTFQGYITIPAEDLYTFYLNSEDGSRLYIDGNLVVDNNGNKAGAVEASGQISLAAGLHTFIVQYAFLAGTVTLTANWESTTFTKTPITAGQFTTEVITPTPTLAPATPGTWADGTQTVTFTAAAGATVYWTVDGTNPDPRSANGSGPTGSTVVLNATATVRAIAVAPGQNPSAIAAVVYTRPLVVNGKPNPLSAASAGVTTEVIVEFDKPLNESTIAPAQFTLDVGTVTAAVPLTRPGVLVAHWKLDGNGTDDAGNNDGVIANPFAPAILPQVANFTNPASANGGTLRFDGTSTTFTAADGPDLDVGAGSFTIAGWFRTTNTSPGSPMTVFSKWDPNGNAGAGLGWLIELQSPNVLRFRMRDNANRLHDSTTAAAFTAANVWVHIAVRVDKVNNRFAVFTNGTLRTSVPASDLDAIMENLDNSEPLRIGYGTDTVGTSINFLSGAADDVRLYKALLAGNDIGALALGSDHISAGVKLTTSALAPATQYTLTIGTGIQDVAGNAVAAPTNLPFRHFPTGTLTHERWTGLTNTAGNPLTDLTRDADFPNNPNSGIITLAIAEVNPNLDSYGARIRGYLIAPSSDSFQFAIASNDTSKLFISTDQSPLNKRLVAYGTAAVAPREFDTASGVQSGAIAMVAGQKYYFEAYQKEGTGTGDNLAVAGKVFDGTAIATGTVPLGDVASVFLAANIAPFIETPGATTQPFSRNVQAGQTFTLTVAARGTLTPTPPNRIQWQRNGVDIAGATAVTYTVPAVTEAIAGNYVALISNTSGTVPSATAVVSIVNTAGLVVNPMVGPTAGGTNVAITGSGFIYAPLTVSFSGTAATNVVATTDTTLTCVTGARAPGDVNVVVSTLTDSLALNAFTYFGVPTGTATPTVGPYTGGTLVTILGSNLGETGLTTVSFGGAFANPVTVATDGLSLTALTIGRAGATVDIIINTPGGMHTIPSGFTYYNQPAITLPINPVNGPLGGVPLLTINGTDLGATGVTQVFFGLSQATNVVVAGNQQSLTCTAPSRLSGATVDVTVTTPGGSDIKAGAFTYYGVPTITPPLNPTAGPLNGFIGLAINGTDLGATGVTQVFFGLSQAGNVVVAGNQQSLTCDAPSHAAGQVGISIITPGGTTPLNNAFTYYGSPTVTGLLNPTAGPTGGVVGLVINGSNLGVTGITKVKFGGFDAANVVVAGNQQSLTCDAPSHAIGQVDVLIDAPGGLYTAPNAFTYLGVPAFTVPVSPGTGPSQGGTPVQITGTNLGITGVTTVSFGGSAATNVVVNVLGTQIDCVTSAHNFGIVSVTVATPGGSTPMASAYEYIGPRIQSILPVSGLAAGNQPVTITGHGFTTGVPTVKLGGADLSGVVVVDDATITGTTSNHAVGIVDVTVTIGGNPAILTNGYEYLDAVTVGTILPSRGPLIGGQLVTIQGTNFAFGNTTVTIDTTTVTANVISTSTLTFTTPFHAVGAVNIGVSTFGTPAVTQNNAYTYVNAPTISSVLPTRGSTLGGQTVTITGTNFETGTGDTVVTFGGVNALNVNVAVGGASLTCSTPGHAAGGVPVAVYTFLPANFTASLPYTYLNPATSIDLSLGMIVDNSAPGMGSNVTFTITLQNSGGIAATNVVVADVLPAGQLTFVSATPTAGAYSAATGLWTLSSLAASASATLTLVATVASPTNIVNTAEVIGVTEADIDSVQANGVIGEDDIFSVTLTAGVMITTPAGPLGGATSGAFYYRQIAAQGGVSPYRWSLSAGTLPFNLDPATGVLSGVAPQAAANYSFTLMASDSSPTPATTTQNFSILVSASAALATATINSTPVPPPAIRGVPYSHFFTATGGPTPYTWTVSAGAPPAGLFLNSVTGQLAGTPTTVGGPTGFTVQVANPNGPTTQAFSITTGPNPISIVTSSLADGSVGAPYDQLLEVSGGIGPIFTWTAPGLPPGLSITGNGRIVRVAGTPASNGAFSVNVQVLDTSTGGASASHLFTGQILVGSAPFAATSSPKAGAVLNRPMLNFSLTGLGGIRPYTWSLVGGTLPAGVTLNGASGIISGTPTESGVFQVVIRGTDSGPTQQSDDHTITLNVAPAPVITTPVVLPNGIDDVAYFAPFSVSGGVAPYSWAVTGLSPLPPGLTLSSESGAIAGIPTDPSFTSLDVEVTDAFGAKSPPKTFTLTILDPAGALTIVGGLPPATVGVPYSGSVLATGGTPPYTFTPVGTPPAWGTFDAATGTLYGLPDGSPVTFQVQVNGSATTSPIVVATPLAISLNSLPGGSTGSSYSATLTTTGAAAPVVWTLVSGSLPAGLTLQSDGDLAGVPQAAGASTFQVMATDAAGRTAQRQLSITVTVGGGAPPAGGGGGGGGGGCGLTGAELLALYLLRRGMRRRER